MRANKLIRRRFLQSIGAGVGALPILSATRASAQSGLPKRLLLVFSPNGTIYTHWTPTGTETDWQLSRILEPLEPHKADIIVLNNLRNEAAHHGLGDGHMKGMGCLWTSTELEDNGQLYAGGASVDQFIAERIKTDTKFRTLELAVQPGFSNIWTRMIYAGPSRPVAPMSNPSEVFQRVFSALLPQDTTKAQALREQRRSVLDFVNRRLQAVTPLLPATDKMKVEAHLEAVRDIERRLLDPTADSTCKKPAAPATLDPNANENFAKVLALQSDLLVQAFACDQTRIASLQWGRSVAQNRMPWLGIEGRHHDLSHEGDGNAQAREDLTRINTWYAEQFAALIAKMKAIPEGTGTMLDNTVIVWGNELGNGDSHTRTRIPFVIAGGGGHFKTGRFLKYNDESHADMLVSLCQYMGVETNTFGNPAYVKGPLRMLT